LCAPTKTTNETELREFSGEAKNEISRVYFLAQYDGRERKIAYGKFVDEAMNSGLEKHARILLSFSLFVLAIP
jgi:hypothetical protein